MDLFIEFILKNGDKSVLNGVHLFLIYLWNKVVEYYGMSQSRQYHMEKLSSQF